MSDHNTVEGQGVHTAEGRSVNGLMSADLVQLRELATAAITDIQTKQKALKKSRDIDYSLSIAQHQLRRLLGLYSEMQKVVDAAPIEDSEALSEIQERMAQVQTQISDRIADWTHSATLLPSKRALKRYFRDVLIQLQSILSDVETELADARSAEQFVAIHRDVFESLANAIAREKQQIELGDLGRSRKSELLEQIHLLSLQIYRFRQLMTEPHLRKRPERFEAIALQIQDTISGLDVEEENATELLDSSTYVLERRLCQLEFNGRWQYLRLPIAWFVNRYKDVTRLQSVQSRVLSGLALSLLISGFTFSLFTLVLTSASALASVSQNDIRKRIETTRDEVIANVEAIITLESEKEQAEIRSATVQAKIDEIRENLIEEGADVDERVSAEEAGEIALSANEAVVDEVEIQEDIDGDAAELARLRERQSEIQDAIFSIENERQRLLGNMEERTERLDTLSLQLSSPLQSDSQSITTMTQALYDAANFLNQKQLLNHLRRILLAAFSGAVGSMMSILIRLEQMDKEDIKNPFLLGALKPLLGAVFGIAVFAILSTGVVDIFPASFSLSDRRIEGRTASESADGAIARGGDPLGDLDPQEMYTIFLVAFIAGFSERLASDTLQSVSSKGAIG